jgi:hypothetical protein
LARELALKRAAAAGAAVVRVPVLWNAVVDRSPGVGFDPADPGSAAYHFAAVDAAVRSVAAVGLTPVITIAGAPARAEAQPRWRFSYGGTWSPDPQAFAAFGAALARRYDGAFPDPAEPRHALPRVRYLQAWNEPNLPRYLEPQWVAQRGRWVPYAALHYRLMLNAFYAAVKRVVPDDVVISAGLAPEGDPNGIGRAAPASFLNTLLCLGPPPGDAPQRCPDPPHFDAFAFHPLSFASPNAVATGSMNVSIADIAKVTFALARARAAGNVAPAGPKPLWITELNWESNPPKADGVPGRLQAAWISRALHRLWIAGAQLVDWQFIVDPTNLAILAPVGPDRPVDRPAGLFSDGGLGPASDRPKPFFYGFRFPFDPLRRDPARVLVWGRLPPGGSRDAVLQRWTRGRWRPLARLRASRGGVINQLVTLRGSARLRLTDGSAGPSPPAKVGSQQFREP